MLNLRPDEIHLWLVAPDEVQRPGLLARYGELLTEEERRRQLRFRFAKDQDRYLITRALVRTVLSRYAAVEPQQWCFAENAYGRPEIANEAPGCAAISFNLSHTDGLIVLGVAQQRALGVDAENAHAKKASASLADRFFSQQESAALRAIPHELRTERFYEYWTLKESYIKARGKGLSIPLDHFSFDLPKTSSIVVSFVPELDDRPDRWRFWLLKPSAECVVAVCAERFGAVPQRLITRRVVPLEGEESFECQVLRESG